MKVLFLDIDGVVNCATTTQRHRGTIGIDPYMAFLVGKILDQTVARMVLSSSWRHFEDGREEVERQVWQVYDVTPTVDGVRGKEIKAWLDKHPEVTEYAILDDDSDMLPEQLPHFFKTEWNTGITEAIANAVIKYLGKEIHWCCDSCGIEANRLTCLKKYGQEPKKAKYSISTYHEGNCDVCGQRKFITEVRDFFYPDFSLLKTNA